jgi:sugar O-acyltransferase (sialic acid O-acetyltransferase NeuD family)
MNIIGAGGHAKVVIDILEEEGTPIEAIWDDSTNLKFLYKHKIQGKISFYKQNINSQAIIAVGDNRVRKEIANLLNKSSFGKAIHPKSYIASRVQVGDGSMVMANVAINTSCIIGEHVIINTNASVDHDCQLEDFVHISPNVALAGNVYVGEGSHIGIGATVIQNLKIGKWVIIGAGAVVINNIPDYAVVVGVPGKIIKYNKEV